MTAVAAERDAVVRPLGPTVEVELGPYTALDTGAVTVLAAGVGPAAAGAATGTALALGRYDLVLCPGIAGGFAGRSAIGDVVVASSAVAADLGADSPDGFLPIDTLGFGTGVLPVPADLVASLTGRLVGARVGPILTVSTVTGTARRAAELAGRWSPAAEAMEGYGVLLAARDYGVPAGEVRSVANAVGPRDRGSWDLPRAFAALTDAAAALFPGKVR